MYKVGVIGLGQIAYHIDKDPNRKIIWSHIKAYQAIKSTNIVSICDVNESLVLEIGQECGINSRYTNYNTMLEENNFDIVSIQHEGIFCKYYLENILFIDIFFLFIRALYLSQAKTEFNIFK